MYEERLYRQHITSRFGIEVTHQESDLYISTDKKIDISSTKEIVKKYYNQVLSYLKENPLFQSSLSPVKVDEKNPDIIKEMAKYSQITGIGPFSSVAGAVAQFVGQELLEFSDEVVVENGGDIFLKILTDKKIGVHIGGDFKYPPLIINLKKRNLPFGLASSSSRFGHSLSFGRADLVTVIADNAIVADGFATAIANCVKQKDDISKVFDTYKENKYISGLLIAFEGNIHLWGEIELAGPE